MARTYRLGTNGGDFLRSVYGDDVINALAGNDFLYDGGRYGQGDLDYFFGSSGDDVIHARWGVDTLQGGHGNDVLVSRSDAGEPVIAQNPALPKVYAREPLNAANDTLDGGVGADKFIFRFDLNARPDIIAKHTAMSGAIDWEGVAGENDAPHLHWLEGIGADTIKDFYRDEGDTIMLTGHTVAIDTIVYADSNGDGRDDYSIVTLKSDQGGAGSHDGDRVGTLRVFGDLVTAADIVIDAAAAHGHVDTIDDAFAWLNLTATAGGDVLRTVAANAKLFGAAGDDTILEGGRKGQADHDVFNGGDGNDIIRSRWGNDVLLGGAGDDTLVSRSDAGEPVVGQIKTAWKIFRNEPLLNSSDRLVGGLGADTFYFRFDLNARGWVLSKHAEENGTIDWHGVAGENSAIHLHWVESIGTDTIADFYRAEGDQIVLSGHTVTAPLIRYADTNADGRMDMSMIYVRSNQGGSGSHHNDYVGLIKVFGNLVYASDIVIDAAPHYGVAENIDDFSAL